MPCPVGHGQQEVVKVVEVDIFEELEKLLEMEKIAQQKGIVKGKIVKVEFGKRKDFFPQERLEELGINPEDDVVVIHIETEWGYNLREVYRVSKHQKSNLLRFFVNYGRPEIGKEVTLKYDKTKSRWRVLL